MATFAEGAPHWTPPQASPAPIRVVHLTKAVGNNAFKLSIPPFLILHPIFNVDCLRPYFPPLLDTSDIAEQLTPIELTAWNMPPYIVSWTCKSRTLANRRSNCIRLSKLANSCTKKVVHHGPISAKVSSSHGGTQCNGDH